MIRR
ncbi:hypothetical protein N7516_001586 [Penicillium verrucosum]|jgi:hypothetical protein